MDALKYVSQVQKYDILIEKKKEQRTEYLAMASCITSPMGGERVQTSGSKQRMADAVIESVEIGEQILREHNELMIKRREIILTLEKLDVTSYEILYLMYVGKMKFDKNGNYKVHYLGIKEIAGHFAKTDTWARSAHRKALAELQKVLDEKEKEVG